MKKVFETNEFVKVNECSQSNEFGGENRVFLSFKGIKFPNNDKEGNANPNSNSFGVSFDNLFDAKVNGLIPNLIKRMRMKRNINPNVAGLLFTECDIKFVIYQSESDTDTFRNKVISKGKYVTEIVEITPNLPKEYTELLMNMQNDWFIAPKKDAPTSIFANV